MSRVHMKIIFRINELTVIHDTIQTGSIYNWSLRVHLHSQIVQIKGPMGPTEVDRRDFSSLCVKMWDHHAQNSNKDVKLAG